MDREKAIAAAEQAIEELDFNRAMKLYSSILQRDPNDTQVMDSLAEVMLELGDVTAARDLLQRSIQLAPESGYSKYMNLGQLLEGAEAASAFRKGIELMMAEHRSVDGTGSTNNRQLASAICTLAELYLTDLCYEDNAEQECQRLLEQALTYSPNDAEVLQTMASLRISQGRNAEALQLLWQSYNSWNRGGRQRMSTEDHDAQEEEEEEEETEYYAADEEAAAQLPSYAFRVGTAKLFLELGQVEPALRILTRLCVEDDEVAEVWQLQGAGHMQAQEWDEAVECLERAQRLLRREAAADPSAAAGELRRVEEWLREAAARAQADLMEK